MLLQAPLKGLADQMRADFEVLSVQLQHRSLKGGYREEALAEFLRGYLPDHVDVVRGELFDTEGSRFCRLAAPGNDGDTSKTGQSAFPMPSVVRGPRGGAGAPPPRAKPKSSGQSFPRVRHHRSRSLEGSSASRAGF